MRELLRKSGWFVLGATMAVVACGHTRSSVTSHAALQKAVVWPASLTPVGEGFPSSGAACRIVGESAATINLLDDSATLVGCPALAEARTLGGTIVATVDGMTLVSVPSAGTSQSVRVRSSDR